MKNKFSGQLAGLAFGLVVLCCGLAQGTTYDAFNDFNPSVNTTNNLWQYGYENSLGSTLNLYTQKYSGVPGVVWWTNGLYNGRDPGVAKNMTGTDFIAIDGGLLFPGQKFLHFHPGQNNQYSIIRWVAPTAGSYQINSAFESLRTSHNTTTDVHVLYNTTSIFDDTINGLITDGAKNFSKMITLNKGDIIDFAVGYGLNHDYLYDSTGLQATITTSVPEPSTMLLLAVGIIGFAGTRFRRKER